MKRIKEIRFCLSDLSGHRNGQAGAGMRLVTGGTGQGKLEYVLLKYDVHKNMVRDSCLPKEDDEIEQKEGFVVINNFQQWVRQRMKSGGCPEDEVMSFLERYENCIIICDEIGNGIVPADPFEREYRERVGRILVQLAKRAEEVERIICGIGQKIK